QVAGFNRPQVPLGSALHPSVGQALSIRPPVHRAEPLIFSQREDPLRVISLAAHHPDFANVIHFLLRVIPEGRPAWAESDVSPVRRDLKPRGAVTKLAW